jgi:hypothetical protein
VTTTRRTVGWLAVAIAALLLAWVVAPAAVPIYDGLGNPDEPYRYVQPPPTAKTTKKPTRAVGVVTVRNGVSGGQFANSAEQGPQISVFVPPGALQVPPGVQRITVTATPLAPQPPLPTDGTIVTNVYDISATANGHPVQIVGTQHQAPSIQMRAPTAQQPGPVFERRTPNGWQQVRTIRVGVDIYQASQVTSFGQYALVQLSKPGAAAKSGGVNPGLLAGGIALLVLTGLIVLIRLLRSRNPAPS